VWLGVILVEKDFDCKQRSYTYLVLKGTTTFKNLSKVLATWVRRRRRRRLLFGFGGGKSKDACFMEFSRFFFVFPFFGWQKAFAEARACNVFKTRRGFEVLLLWLVIHIQIYEKACGNTPFY
jgi:hypothetical protein